MTETDKLLAAAIEAGMAALPKNNPALWHPYSLGKACATVLRSLAGARDCPVPRAFTTIADEMERLASSNIFKEWLSGRELYDLALPGLPRDLNMHLKFMRNLREQHAEGTLWKRRRISGGGFHYQSGILPPTAQHALDFRRSLGERPQRGTTPRATGPISKGAPR